MKRFTSLLSILFMVFSSYAQGHFNVAWSGFGNDHMNIYAITATIGGVALEAGDEIAVFDGSICCAKATLTRSIDISDFNTFAALAASRIDEGKLNGYTPGDPITYKFWDASKNMEISGITAEYFQNDGQSIPEPTFTPNTTALVKLSVATPTNQAPIANAGPDQTVNEGDMVTLDGSGSSDPEAGLLTYQWTAPSGISLSSTTAEKPTFTAPEVSTDTNFTFSLVVNDGTDNSTADEVVITVRQVNKPPVANAGPDQNLLKGTLVTLDGSASSDPDADPLTYQWTAPAGITLSSDTEAKPTFTAPNVGVETDYTFSLTVSDGTLSSAADEVVIKVKPSNNAPTANAGPDQTVNEGATTTLDGSASSDPDADLLTYQWTAPAGITLSSETAEKPTFTAPEVSTDTDFTFSLVVNDGTVNSVADEVKITVKQVNKAPVANAGPDQSVNEGATATLDGSASSDPDGDALTYKWTAPPGFTLSSTTVVNPTFTAPEVSADTQYTFSLVVNDGQADSPADVVVVTVLQVNKAPVANAGPDHSVNEGATATLDGSASSDPDGDALTYKWTAPPGFTLSSTTVVNPTFTAPEVSADTQYTFSLVVNDGQADSPADEVVVTVLQVNKAPVANAGPDHSVNEGATATLDGSASSDPDGDALTYKWTAPPRITLSSETIAQPTFTAPEVSADTQYTFSLVVNDGQADSPADVVVVTVLQVNKAPVANAGPDQSVNEGATATLDGSASSDPDGDALTYKWTAPPGITLSSETIAQPTFTAPEVSADTQYTFSLVVNDGQADSPADEVVVTVLQVNKAPVANAGPDQSVKENDLVTLDGSASSDPDGDALTYKWTAPTGFTLSSETAEKPTFTAPGVTADTEFTFSLVVNDGMVNSASDKVIITVKPLNQTPTANAGPDQTVNEGDMVTLDGSGSSDPDANPLTYQWTAPSGITLSSATAEKPTFTAPEVSTDTDFTFSLVVNDGTVNSVADEVKITVKQVNKAPVANAGPDQTVNEGAVVTLDGSGSSDPDANPLTYQWTAPSGITLSSATAEKPTFTAPEVSTDTDFTFSLVVNDGTVNSVADEVKITVKQVNKAPVANAGPDQTVNEGAVVTLDGSGSSDPDANPLTFHWTAPSGIKLTSPTLIKVTVTGPAVTTTTDYNFSLDLFDGSASDTPGPGALNFNWKVPSGVSFSSTTITTITITPETGGASNKYIFAVNVADGSDNSDPMHNGLTYFTIAPTEFELSSKTIIKLSVDAGEKTTLTAQNFSLEVSSGSVTTMTYNWTMPAGLTMGKETVAKLIITTPEGTGNSNYAFSMILDNGTTPTGPGTGPLTYHWIAPHGIVLSSETDPNPTFTAPEVGADTDYTFTLIVNDGLADSPPDHVVIRVKQVNKAPVAHAGPDQAVNEGATVSLNGSGSSDPDGDALTYHWIAPSGIILSSATDPNPSFTAPEVNADTEYTLTLFVNDGKLDSPFDQVVVTVKQVNKAPVANAGMDQAANEGATVSLDGSVSSDPDGNVLTYKWTAPVGITLSSVTDPKPTFTAPEVSSDTDFTFSLRVSDGQLLSPFDQVIVTVKQVNKAPVANAGTDQAVNEGTTVSLDGSASSDPDGNALTYKWTAPAGITLSSTTEPKPTFTAPEVTINTSYTLTLVVNDGLADSPADHVVITVKQVNKAPVANAGSDQTVNEGATVSLDGSASSDPDGNPLTYKWTAPAGITLSSTTEAKPTFTAPDVTINTSYTLTLVVNDGLADSPADHVVITVKQVNKAPVANAGTDQAVNEGATVSLDGSASSDPDGNPLTYKWTAPAGITLSSTTDAKPTFTAPEVTINTSYTLTLVVNDGLADSPADHVVITVKQVNKAPVANAGSDQTVNEGATVSLDGSASSDPDGNPLTYKWTAPAGITLSSTTDAKPTFTAPEVTINTSYTLTLVVNDGLADSPTDHVVITVKQVNKAPVANAGADQAVNEGATVSLDGSASSDPDGNPLTYKWTAPAGITLSSTTDAKPTFTAPEVTINTSYTLALVVNDGLADSPADHVVITVLNVDHAPYIKDPIKNVSVDKGAPDQIIDLKNVFADDDPGDVLIFSVISNTNEQVVQAKITGSNLTLDFSNVNIGSSEIVVTASSNGKEVNSKFEVEVNIPTGVDPLIEDVAGIQVYPNPTSGKVKISFNGIPHTETYLEVYDVKGQTILKQFISNKEEWIDLNGNQPGVYLLKVNSDRTYIKKIILK